MMQKYTICKSDWEALQEWRKQAVKFLQNARRSFCR